MSRSFLRRRAEQRIQEAQDNGELDQLAQSGGEAAPREPGKPAEERPFGRRPGDWRGLVEQRIQEGIEKGVFDNLRGAGKPLNLDDDALVPEDMRMAFRLLRSNGLAPLWVEMNKEIRDDLERLRRFRAHVRSIRTQTNPIQSDHLRRDYVRRIEEINGKILNYNILAPSSYVHFQSLILEEELTRYDLDTSD
jgi:DnaJ family protein C protein 28